MDYRFRVDFLEEAKEFLDSLDEKSRDKVFYNIWKSRSVNNKELFEKLQGEIWEFRTLYSKTYFRLLAFWDKEDKSDTLIIATHGVVKKTGKYQKVKLKKRKG